MDKRTAWLCVILACGVFLGTGVTAYGIYYAQSERIDVLQRESKEKSDQIQALNSQMGQLHNKVEEQSIQLTENQKTIAEHNKDVEESRKQLMETQKKMDQLVQKVGKQTKTIEEIKKANF